MPYSDPNLTHNPSTGAVAPAAWGDVLRDDLEFLIDPPACSAYNSTSQTVATATATVLNADSETFDNDSMHSTVTNNSRITAQTAGRYLFAASANFAANTTGIRQVQFFLNGTTAFGTYRGNAANTFDSIEGAVASRVLAAGDYVEVRAYQSSGGNLAVTLVEFTAIFLTR